MPSEDTKMLKFNQYQKSDKTLYIVYANLESLIKKVEGCKDNPVKSFTPVKFAIFVKSSLLFNSFYCLFCL